MKTLLFAAIAGVFLFAGSATVSWYLMNQQQQIVEEGEEETVDELDPTQSIPPVTAKVKKEENMPVGLRPDAPITVESVMELSRSIRKTEQQLKEREKQIARDREGLKLMFEDLQRERDELTAFSNQVESKVRALRELVEQMKVENEKLASSRSEVSVQTPGGNGDGADDDIKRRVSVATKYLAGMEDSIVANMMKQWANDGNIDYAGRVLKTLDERKGSSVLAALQDPVLADQILRAAGNAQ